MARQIRAWLKSGAFDRKEWFPTEEGTPQGGVISPLLADIALRGKSSNGKPLGFKLLIKPSKEKVNQHYRVIADSISRHKTAPQSALIAHLNPVIRGWANYYSTVVSKDTYSRLDNLMFKRLLRWGKRRHPNKSHKWVANKYWQSIKTRKWVFATKDGLRLTQYSDTPIVRHVKVKGKASPYDGDMVYWSSRMGKHPEMPKRKAKLLKAQKGKCSYCGHHFKTGDLLEEDHIIPTAHGGKNEDKNLQLLHKHCHDRKTAQDGSLGTRDKSHTAEEPGEGKLSRPVLETS